jgi:type IV pilus assembly protein PilC
MTSAEDFVYYGIGADGQVQSGSVSASDREAAMDALRERGIRVLSLERSNKGRFGPLLRGRVNAEDFIQFNTSLASLTKSSRPLPEGLRAIVTDMQSGRFRAAVEDVRAEIEGGRSLSDALNRRSDLFSDLYVRLVRAGEASGDLGAVLLTVARQSRGLLDMRRRLQEALFYPTIVVWVVLAIYALFSLLIAPQLALLYAEMTRGFGPPLELPALTRLVLWTAKPSLMIPVCALVGCGLILAWTAGQWTVTGRRFFDAIVSRLPVARDVQQSYELSRIAGALSMMLRGGVPMVEALGALMASCGKGSLANALGRTAAAVSEGKSFSESLGQAGFFPRSLTWMVSMGEQSHELPAILADIADLYEGRAARAASLLDALLVPVVVSAMGLLVGGVVCGILMPFTQMMKWLGGG